MKYFNFTQSSDIVKQIDFSTKGEKFGEKVVCIKDLDQLKSTDANFVLVGIPSLLSSKDDLGIKISEVYQEFLKPLLNIQNNQYNRGANLLVLGHIDTTLIFNELSELNSNSEKIEKFNDIVNGVIFKIIQAIISSGKTPIAIGGCHSDTLSILKAMKALQHTHTNLLDLSTEVNLEIEKNAINFHQNDSWLETLNINKYGVFGLHKNYVSQKELEVMNLSKKLNFHFFEDCLHLTTLDKCVKFKNAVDFHLGKLGFRLDLNSVLGMSSKCESSSGFSIRDIRTFIKMIRKENIQFLHICDIDSTKNESISNSLSYIISDFIRVDV